METINSVAIIGGTIWGNRGAEAMLVTTIGKIRELDPKTRFVVYSYYPKRDRELVNDPNIKILSGKPISLVVKHFPFAFLEGVFNLFGIHLPDFLLTKEILNLRKARMLLDIGGITFSDGREVYLPFNIVTILPSMFLKVPVIKLAQAIGPFDSPINRICAKLLLPKCEHIFARGEKTAHHLGQLPLKTEKWDRVTDVAFLYKPEYSLTNENEVRLDAVVTNLLNARMAEKKIIAISPSSLVLEQSNKRGMDYIDKILNIIRMPGNQSCQFVILPNATREGSDKGRNNDIVSIRKIRKRAMEQFSEDLMKNIEWIDFDINTKSIRKVISQAHVLVTSRYHAMIAGLSLAVPTVVLGWGHKYAETLSDFGLQQYSVDFNNPVDDLAEKVTTALENQAVIHNQLQAKLTDVISASEIQFKYLESLIN